MTARNLPDEEASLGEGAKVVDRNDLLGDLEDDLLRELHQRVYSYKRLVTRRFGDQKIHTFGLCPMSCWAGGQ